ncbi:NAD(P)/FAD-dependent oxidoreductase [Bradyrhizobium sp. WSM 1704]|uniref:flavin-containing monooxygenase n=1 Tax=Bradyrhizobium semiaridum TaxID=2821404 RepID=UPI001CE3AF6B|nr:NAD(P)/FAD-dependent oxidoreductase [Bradyrhizobium semiaridum]MCA6123183.1 NAD(P)/FAD-dependent oxidoreductase [Bradyrhizobium semiaridum]
MINASNGSFRVAIIGAGASGIATAVYLARAGIAYTIFERADDVGGTWRDNTYPGLACDVPSHLYRYSFAPNAEWSHEYSPAAEIHAYFRRVADELGVLENVRLSSEVTRAQFVGEGMWRITTVKGDEGLFNAVVAATGVLHKPVLPEIEGRDSFAGASFHSSRWDHSVPLAGRRVGIIGTGSTATQILPAIVDEVASVSLFQRTPQWIINVPNNPFSEAKKTAFRNEPQKMADLYEHLNNLFNERFAASLVGENAAGLAEMARACRQNLEDNVRDPDLRRRLTPSYQAGCKRLIVSDKFYPAIQRPNAHLVDTAIMRIEPAGVRTKDGLLHDLDVIVYATGFDPFTFFRPATIVGRNGVSLNERWKESCQAYRSVAVPDFPNLFFIGGPNSPIGNFSFLRTAEVQIGYVTQLIKLLAEGACREVEPTQQATDAFNSDVEQAIKHTVWVTGGCTSWYFDKQGKVVSWPWSYGRFEADLKQPRMEEFKVA